MSWAVATVADPDLSAGRQGVRTGGTVGLVAKPPEGGRGKGDLSVGKGDRSVAPSTRRIDRAGRVRDCIALATIRTERAASYAEK